jgi:hypothetical protein
MNKSTLIFSLIIFNLVAGNVPNTFTAGETAKAADVNENFSYLLEKLDSLTAALDSVSKIDHTGNLQSTVDSLKTELVNTNSTVDSLKTELGQEDLSLPIGSIVASMLAEEKFQEINGDDWVLADGRESSTEYFNATANANIPDLRGMFLRGLNAGRDDGNEDPNTSRVAGDFQVDEFKSHRHLENLATGSGGAYSGGTWGTVYTNYTDFTGGAETRPRNMAVYWFIKVK